MKQYLGKRKVLRIYISNEDMFDGKPLWEVLLAQSKASGLAGATVLKAAAGMGVHSEVHAFNVWALKQKMPLILEMIDTQEKIDCFLQETDEMISEGLVTLSDIDVIAYKHPKFGDA